MNGLDFTSKQRGATLLISLILLLVLTILALAAGRSATLQQRMAGNQQQQNLAFQAAENGIQAAIIRLQDADKRPAINGKASCLYSEKGEKVPKEWEACKNNSADYYQVRVTAETCAGSSSGSIGSIGNGISNVNSSVCYKITSTGQVGSIKAIHQQGYVF